MEIEHFESDNEGFIETFKNAIEGHEPAVVPKIVRSYKTNTGCLINHSCVLLLGQDYTTLTIAHQSRPVSFEEESYFYPFVSGNIKDYYIIRDEELKDGFMTTISNQEELVEDDIEESS